VCALEGWVPDSQELIRAVGGQHGEWPPICLSPQSRTPGRINLRLVRRWCTQARHSPPPDWRAWSESPSSRPALTLRCFRTAFQTLAREEHSPQRSHPEIVSTGAAIPHGALNGSCHAPVNHTTPALRPSGRQNPHAVPPKTALKIPQHPARSTRLPPPTPPCDTTASIHGSAPSISTSQRDQRPPTHKTHHLQRDPCK
jgi:hypothetical protein